MGQLSNWLRNGLADTRGQGMTEYLVLVAIVVLAAFAAFNLFARGIVDYYQRITMVVSLPIP